MSTTEPQVGAPPDTPIEPPPDPRRWLVLAVMSVGTLIVFLDNTVINTALPSIATDLSATTSQLQWVIDAYTLVLAGLLLLGGSIGDRYGRRRWMTIGLVLFMAGSVMGGLADSIEMLIGARVVQGLGGALVLPATLSIVTNTFPRAERGKAIAIWTAVGGLGVGLGPAVGGFLVEQWDWAAAFWIHVPVIAVALIGMLVVPESRDPRHVGLDVPGAVTATAGITALVFAIIQGGESGWSSPLIVGSFTAAVVLLASFVVIERRARFPMLPLDFFRRRDFTGSVIILGAVFFAGIAMFFFMTQFFQLIQGRSPFEAGLLILPNAAAIVIGTGIAQATLGSIGPRRLVTVGVALMAVSIVIFTTVDVGSGATFLIADIMLFGLGWGLAAQPLTDTVMASVPVEDAGIGSAVNDVSRELGSALGVAVIGSFVSSLYRSGVEDELAGRAPEELIEVAGEGIGPLAVASQQLPDSVAGPVMAGATSSFMDAMTSGFWLSAAITGGAVVLGWFLLPDRIRTEQVEREDTDVVPDASTPDPVLAA